MPTRALFCDYRGLWLDSDLACAATPACVLPCVFLQHVALRGRPEFKRSLQRRTENIKACLRTCAASYRRRRSCGPRLALRLTFLVTVVGAEFRGPPDPLRGDEPYRKVREAAKVRPLCARCAWCLLRRNAGADAGTCCVPM